MLVSGDDLVELALVVIEQIQFVHGDDDVLAADLFEQSRVAFGLRQQDQWILRKIQTGSIHQHNRRIGCGRTSHHIACVLLVSWGVGDDEFAFWGAEIAVGHIDGDALFAFGFQAIGQTGQIQSAACAAFVKLRHLVGEQGLAVVQQAANQSGFAIVYTACGDEAQY